MMSDVCVSKVNLAGKTYAADFRSAVCVQNLDGHAKDISSCCFHDSSILATASSDKTVRLWKLSETLAASEPQFVEELVSPLTGHSYGVNSVVFAPQRALLASGSTDGTVFFWDPRIGEKVACLHHESGASVRSCSFSPSGTYFASSADDGTICIWDASSFILLKKLDVSDSEASVESVRFSNDGSLLLVGTSTGRIIVFNADPLTAHSVPIATVADAHDLGVTCLSVFMNGVPSNGSVVIKDLLASGGTDCAVKLWELIANAWKGTAELTPCGKPLLGHSGTVMCVCFHPSERIVFSAGGDKTVRVWDVALGVCLAVCSGHERYVTCCSVSSDGRWLATGSNDRTIKIWRLDGAVDSDPSAERTKNLQLWTVPGARLVQPTACWTVDDVCDWLDDLGLQQYVQQFREKRVSGSDMSILTAKSLEVDFGMDNASHRLRLLNELRGLLRQWDVHPEEMKKIPVEFFCPITHNIMVDPVVAKDGYTYERSAIEEWLSKKRTSPLTNEVMISTELTPNLTLKAVMNRLLLSSESPVN